MGTVVIFVIASILLMGTVSASQYAFADGADSPNACLSMNANVFSDTSGGTTTVDAGAGNTISSICIKDGQGSFANPIPLGPFLQHSHVITADGNYGISSCYMVSGFSNMQMVTVTDNCGGAMAVSHVDYTVQTGTPPAMVAGSLTPIDTTMVLLAGTQSISSWMIPVIVAGIGIGIVIARKF